MQETQLTQLSQLGQLIELKRQAVCIYAQAANAMYAHHIKWSFKLREISSQSQRQHDALCRIADGDRFMIANVRTYAFVEQPETKNEIIFGALDLLLDLEQDIVSTECEHREYEEMFANIHDASKYYMQWLQYMLETFDTRFVASKRSILSCQLCGWRMQVKERENYGNVRCEICGGRNSMG